MKETVDVRSIGIALVLPNGTTKNLLRAVLRSFVSGRVSNRKGRSMQNEFISVVSSRPTLGKIESTP